MIREASLADAYEIAAILAETESPWSEDSVKSSIVNNAHTVLIYGEVDGVLIYSEAAGEYEVLNLAVKSMKQKKGIGDRLLSVLTCKPGGVYLDVRKSNTPAICLYKKHGFTVAGERKNYYDNPPEDAVLMVFHK